MLTKERFAWVWVGALVAVLGAYAHHGWIIVGYRRGWRV